ncbi:LIVCS family branched-chain amino acid:cation transporter [Clostridium tetanomorphum]|uniref:branched-chain amino acid transport system II carrier protein n=1 Tax=Clostridium tetanomorphum TaxID=1553 RepID=UPI0004460437|nr:branched-chain amino acid transport system II carrier protein [Clostridium tetanomorphum]KAJ49056.1 branched chain amino acid transport system II carrier protein [Clostridium tetanomorphum DSM 665]KAJ53785.1 branched chain amino acid transport system II carrier protein [Clostridium tetanomorphum DSM 665]MBP1862518.1 LIVCS family branched-chain amino acid:cation transporter [Clostridium tetanomorphum]NRS85641.1 LIVCS family branched-chain amino acid:cation transporter [Clostridium tetanomorph
MEKENTKLSPGKLFLMGGALFSMHFGGSSMIWPMTWGKESGNSIFPAFIGIYLTALFFPLLGYLALSRAKGTFYQVSERVSHRFANFFCSMAMLVLGPLFCIPRMSAAAWDAFLQVSKFQPQSYMAPLIFSIFYYSLTYWFIAKKSDAVDKISRILFPVLVIAVIAIISKGILFPISTVQPKVYGINAFAYGFKNGYATAELLCALVFATIIIDDLKFKGIIDRKLDINLMKVGLIGIGMLTLTHLGHMIVGSLTGTTFGETKYAALYSAVVLKLWGNVGGMIFNIALLFAALTTAIGLAVATANYFQEVTNKKISYNKSAIITLIISAIVSAIGLSSIVELAAPLLDIVYPAAITMTLFYAFIPNLDIKRRTFSSYKFGIITALIWGIFEGILTYMDMFKIDVSIIKKIHDFFPFTSVGLGWISITFIAIIIGAILNIDFKNKTIKSIDLYR